MREPLEEHVPRVYRFALRLTGDHHLAEDLTQETFARAWRHRRRLRDPSAARVWLFRIAANLWRDHSRRLQRHPTQVEASLDDQSAPTESPGDELLDREDLQRALAAMDSLPLRQRQVLYLHACEGLSLAEISEILEISVDAAKASLSLARRQLRRKLADVCRDRFPAN